MKNISNFRGDMQRTDYDWKGGKITFWDLDRIDAGKEASSQLGELKEDLAQVEFPDDVILDVGWCPEFALNGRFRVAIVKCRNWESPFWLRETRNAKELHDHIQQAIKLITAKK